MQPLEVLLFISAFPTYPALGLSHIHRGTTFDDFLTARFVVAANVPAIWPIDLGGN